MMVIIVRAMSFSCALYIVFDMVDDAQEKALMHPLPHLHPTTRGTDPQPTEMSPWLPQELSLTVAKA